MEVVQENIPSVIFDKHVDIKTSEKLFTVDGWIALKAVYNALKTNHGYSTSVNNSFKMTLHLLDMTVVTSTLHGGYVIATVCPSVVCVC